jgi:hypothetical protein
MAATAYQHGSNGPPRPGRGAKNSPQGVTKRASEPGRTRPARWETFRNAGDPENGAAGWPVQGSLRGKRSDPSPRANVPPPAEADPGRSGPDANDQGHRVWALSVNRRRNRSGHTGTEASLNNPEERKLPDGPAARPTTPLAVENSVGEPAAHSGA